MAITTAIYNTHPHKTNALLVELEQQFALDQDVLISITSHFHKLFNLGLSDYGHPMAICHTSDQVVVRAARFPFLCLCPLAPP
jgi:hypothetical protein